MRTKIILLCTIAVLCAACSNNEDEITITDDSVLSRSEITYSGDVQGVSVLIFGSYNGDYYYQGGITSGWVGNRVSTNLELGHYKFLFYKADGSGMDMKPFPLTSSVKFEDIRFESKTDPDKPGYVLPVEEIWMPETTGMADEVHAVTGNDLIKNTLKRAVSQVELYVQRGELAENEYTPIPFVNDDHIMNYISEIHLDISGVGQTLNYAGTTGNKKIYYSADQESSLTDEGFAYFEGPFVLPAEASDEEATVDIRLIPKAGSILEDMELKTTVTGKLERNKKLSIKVWLTSTYNIIYVDVDTTEITSVNEGDEGIWE